MDALTEAEARAARNGLSLEFGDTEAGVSWPDRRYASVHLMRGREQVASAAMSYHDDAGKERALRFCLTRVYYRPIGADQAHVTQGRGL